MRLKYIKLAGFKSFVDPTKVPFEQQMTAIVGPNGCGKSNIIDAVRWVLGESSAKHLRGDAMTDVIFNGAATRKPIGQASVELMFDNMAGRLAGSLADRNQISVKRVVNRDSQNTYFLNGTKCRRRDITDIFLGTGLGPRSYGIIEQGTISRLIESKPQELRIFVEEAAGISKYKERRRDTENRIRHTRENLARLTDLRLELGQHIEKLHGQAEAAKRFKTLKKQERQYKIELAALRWQKYDVKVQKAQEGIVANQQMLENLQLANKADTTALEANKVQQANFRTDVEKLQQDKLQLTNDIARLEQHLQFVQQQKTKIEQDRLTCAEQIEKAQNLLLNEQKSHQNSKARLAQLEPELDENQRLLTLNNQKLINAKDHLAQAQQLWQELNAKQQKTQNRAVEQSALLSALQTKIASHEKLIATKQAHYREISNNLTKVNVEQFEPQSLERIDRLSQLIADKEKELLSLGQTLQVKKEKISSLHVIEATKSERLKNIERQLKNQQEWQQKQADSIATHLGSEPNLFRRELVVVPGWEVATEMVFDTLLSAHLITLEPSIYHELQHLNTISLMLQGNSKTNKQPVSNTLGTLAEKVSHPSANLGFLTNIFIVDNESEAYTKVVSLKNNQSVICPQGLWLSSTFMRKGKTSSQDGLLLLEREHFDIRQNLEEIHTELKHLNVVHDQLKAQQLTVEQVLENERDEYAALVQQRQQCEQANELKCQLKAQDEKVLNTLDAELVQLTTELNAWQRELAPLSNSALNTPASDVDIAQAYERVQGYQQEVLSLTNSLQALQEKHHQGVIQVERAKHQTTAVNDNIMRYQASIEQLSKQQAQLQSQMERQNEPIATEEKQLQHWLNQMGHVDEKIADCHKQILETTTTAARLEQNQKDVVEKVTQLRETINQKQIEIEANKVKAEAALTPLQELHIELGEAIKQMPFDAKEGIWQAHVNRLQRDIEQLGPINLAAIDEFESQLNRKNFLDQQDQDLNQAISTLESAIAKIDKESRQKFKVTFDKINQDLQRLFPKVFGGGRAYLALTGDDLLETGVSIMAQPPGKKNSTIHLLSGGEKALTALSLVFAIFRLNPAPFCMLDEVDAPLDDANVNRFCKLVKEMSNSVQFIYISHNKIAMEMASHLTGVTMFEPGVSRMVSVDIDEAVAMAEVS